MDEKDSMWCTCDFYGWIGVHPDWWRYCSEACVRIMHWGSPDALPSHVSFLRLIRARLEWERHRAEEKRPPRGNGWEGNWKEEEDEENEEEEGS